MKKLLNESLRKNFTEILATATSVNKKEFDTTHSIDVIFPDNVCPDSYLYDSEADRDADFALLDESLKQSKKD